ncbi:MAG: 3-deoxy-D-manno-octulosonic acid transferase [Phycisphaerae bacterium]|nr:3-deoxy-D-manno-octulosonic acid transferase [Phycisphaerae bacterium]
MGILLDILYAAGLAVLSPVWGYRMIRHGRYREDIAQRFGAVPARYGLQPTIWVHGVSLGEVNAARTLIDALHAQLPDYRVVVSTTTETGMAQAQKLYAPDHMVFRWPLDFTWAVGRALRRIRPELVVLMEGEIWPNFLAACNRSRVPVVLVNGRMSADKGYPRYRRLGPLAGRLFNRLTAVGVQHERYAERFASLGAAPEKLRVTGMMKFDTAEVVDRIDGQDALAAALGIDGDEPLVVAGGTGSDEEALVLDAFAEVLSRHETARLALVPRKPERFDEVARLVRDRNFALARRRDHADGAASPHGRPPVILGDTMGELRKFYALADAVFVGRSLVPAGGSDMIEAAALGKAVCFGPHTFNFPQADDMVAHGCVRVTDADGLARRLSAWLDDPTAAAAAGAAAREYVRSQQGATRRTVAMICDVLGREPAVADGAMATPRIREDHDA